MSVAAPIPAHTCAWRGSAWRYPKSAFQLPVDVNRDLCTSSLFENLESKNGKKKSNYHILLLVYPLIRILTEDLTHFLPIPSAITPKEQHTMTTTAMTATGRRRENEKMNGISTTLVERTVRIMEATSPLRLAPPPAVGCM